MNYYRQYRYSHDAIVKLHWKKNWHFESTSMTKRMFSSWKYGFLLFYHLKSITIHLFFKSRFKGSPLGSAPQSAEFPDPSSYHSQWVNGVIHAEHIELFAETAIVHSSSVRLSSLKIQSSCVNEYGIFRLRWFSFCFSLVQHAKILVIRQ